MKKLEIFVALLIGVLTGTVLIAIGPTYSLGQEAQALITECEKTLPRNQHCVIKAEAENVPY